MTIISIATQDVQPVLALEKQRLNGKSLTEEEVTRSIHNDGFMALVAKENERLVGYVLASLSGREAEIQSIAVAADYEGQGIGTGLLEFLKVRLAGMGVERVLLEVSQENERALRLYKSSGFGQYSVRKGYYDGKDAICMDQDLKDGKHRVILSLESSCDETAAAVLDNGILKSNIVSTQIKEHQKYGGVYPELASRLHLQNVASVIFMALTKAGVKPEQLTHVAVTAGPGLPGALQVGVIAAKTVADFFGIPLIGVHHLAGHLYANEYAGKFKFPLIAVIASGGNSEIVLMKHHLDFDIVGQTLDDAIGEAFDKVAREIGLPYPGGVYIDRLCKANPDVKPFPLPKPRVAGYNLSYSGLKSHVIRLAEHEKAQNGGKLSEQRVVEYAKSVEVAFVDEFMRKAMKAADYFHAKEIVIGGGVSANSYLRYSVLQHQDQYQIIIPPMWCTTDNASMIAKAADHLIDAGYGSDLSLPTDPGMDLNGFPFNGEFSGTYPVDLAKAKAFLKQ